MKEYYTHGHASVVVGSHAQRTAEDSAAFLLPHLRPGTRLLDFGCGPGSITKDLGEQVTTDGLTVGLDQSNEALTIAAAQQDGHGVHYLCGSVYETPFGSDSFDAAYGHQILQHLADPVGALKEMHRVLKPGGLIAVRDADFGTMVHHPHYPELDEWLDLYHQVGRANGGEPDAGRRLVSWADQAGFVDIVATTSTWTYATEPERRAWASLWAERIMLPRFTERVTDLGVAAVSDVARIAAGWRRWGEEPNGWFSFIHGEVIASAT